VADDPAPLMSKRGRKRRSEAVREPNGRRQRPRDFIEAREARETVLSARERVLGVSRIKAEQREAGFGAIGRAFLLGELSSEQVEAAGRYEQIHRDYLYAIAARHGVSSGSDFDRQYGFDGDEGDNSGYIEWCNAAKRRYSDARRELLHADPLAHFAIEAWVIDNVEAWSLIGELRIGLNAIARMGQQRRAA
jgi:hypothetical protein